MIVKATWKQIQDRTADLAVPDDTEDVHSVPVPEGAATFVTTWAQDAGDKPVVRSSSPVIVADQIS